VSKFDQHNIAPAVLAEAAEWFAVLNSGDVSQQERQQWQVWLSSHPDHQAAWSRVEFFTHRFDGLPPKTAAAVLAAPALQRRRALKSLAVFAALGLSSFEFWRSGLIRTWSSNYHTGIATQNLVLADGSRVSLDAATAIDVDFSAELRRIHLVAGEIYIETAPDNAVAQRPFVVDSAEGRVRALGTRFSVRQQQNASHTAVFAGAVEITPQISGAFKQTLQAGQETLFSNQNVETPRATDSEQPAWTQGVLLADNLHLGEFVLQLNRYRHGYITCSPEAASLRLVGAYPLQNTDRILLELTKTLPVKISQITPLWIRIELR